MAYCKWWGLYTENEWSQFVIEIRTDFTGQNPPILLPCSIVLRGPNLGAQVPESELKKLGHIAFQALLKGEGNRLRFPVGSGYRKEMTKYVKKIRNMIENTLNQPASCLTYGARKAPPIIEDNIIIGPDGPIERELMGRIRKQPETTAPERFYDLSGWSYKAIFLTFGGTSFRLPPAVKDYRMEEKLHQIRVFLDRLPFIQQIGQAAHTLEVEHRKNPGYGAEVQICPNGVLRAVMYGDVDSIPTQVKKGQLGVFMEGLEKYGKDVKKIQQDLMEQSRTICS